MAETIGWTRPGAGRNSNTIHSDNCENTTKIVPSTTPVRHKAVCSTPPPRLQPNYNHVTAVGSATRSRDTDVTERNDKLIMRKLVAQTVTKSMSSTGTGSLSSVLPRDTDQAPKIVDLCAADKKRVAKLIEELGKQSAQKNQTLHQLAVERSKFEQQLQHLTKNQYDTVDENRQLKVRLSESQMLLSSYKLRLSSLVNDHDIGRVQPPHGDDTDDTTQSEYVSTEQAVNVVTRDITNISLSQPSSTARASPTKGGGSIPIGSPTKTARRPTQTQSTSTATATATAAETERERERETSRDTSTQTHTQPQPRLLPHTSQQQHTQQQPRRNNNNNSNTISRELDHHENGNASQPTRTEQSVKCTTATSTSTRTPTATPKRTPTISPTIVVAAVDAAVQCDGVDTHPPSHLHYSDGNGNNNNNNNNNANTNNYGNGIDNSNNNNNDNTTTTATTTNNNNNTTNNNNNSSNNNSISSHEPEVDNRSIYSQASKESSLVS